MKGSHDWLHRGHVDLYQQVVLTWNFINAPGNRARMGFAADTTQGIWFDTVFTPAFNNYGSAYVGWISPADRTPVIVNRLEKAEAAFTPLYRQLYTGMLRNSLVVTDDDLLAMGLPKRSSGGRTPSPVATDAPDADADTSKQGRVGIIFFEKGGEHKKGKPPGQHGVEIRWAVLDTPPERWDELVHSEIDTNSPFTLAFERDQRGKILYFALRWENTRGEKGPWSDIMNVAIP